MREMLNEISVEIREKKIWSEERFRIYLLCNIINKQIRRK